MTRCPDEQQVLALAAIFQAAVLADRLANGYQAHPGSVGVLTESVLSLDSSRVDDVFPEAAVLDPGLAALERVLRHGRDRDGHRPVAYALGLIQLAHRLRKNTNLTAILRNRLETLRAQRPHFDDPADTNFCHRLAGIYQDTLGTLRFHIRVQGQPEYLNNDDTAARIRALFLGGIRAAFLWHQAGGRRYHFLTRRPRLLKALEQIKSHKINNLH
jgi:high frequency lysogenization protein